MMCYAGAGRGRSQWARDVQRRYLARSLAVAVLNPSKSPSRAHSELERRSCFMQQKTESLDQIATNDAERQARIDLAAAHRAAVMHGFHEGIFNHLTLSVPGKTDRYYQ